MKTRNAPMLTAAWKACQRLGETFEVNSSNLMEYG
jgi:hypothetical protein